MDAKIQKWGNSLAVRFPKETLRRLKLTQGSRVIITSERTRISIKPVIDKKPILKDMVKEITKDNFHNEIHWGSPIGREVF